MESNYSTANLRNGSKPLMHDALNLPGYPERREVKLSEVVHLEGSGNYVYIHLLDGKKLVVAHTLANYESLSGFVRIHKRHIVNVGYIVSLNVKSRTETWVHLMNGIQLPISRRRAGTVLDELKSKVETSS